jgi:hypothetical protein
MNNSKTSETHFHSENTNLIEILNNINTGIYQINDYDNIRIYSKNKPDFVILTVETDILSNNIIRLFENQKNNDKFSFEKTFIDYIVVSINQENSQTISLFELIISSYYLDIDDNEKWKLDTDDFNCIEIDYVEKELIENIEKFGMDFNL